MERIEYDYHRPQWRITLDSYLTARERFLARPRPETQNLFDMHRHALELGLDEPSALQLGAVRVYDGAIDLLERGMHHAEEFLFRHQHGDYGLVGVAPSVDTRSLGT